MKSGARFLSLAAVLSGLCGNACSSTDSGGSPPPPAGACHTTETAATGSSDPTCNACVKTNCNAELSQKMGSGWASQYLGGDGACADFNACECDCSASSADPGQLFNCVTTTCAGRLDSACQAATNTANQCITTHCSAECR